MIEIANTDKHYVNGRWVEPLGSGSIDVFNPATESAIATVALGDASDVDRAVTAARTAFGSWSQSTKQERLDLLGAVAAAYTGQLENLAAVISAEMGAPMSLASRAQAPAGLGHVATTIEVLSDFEFSETRGANRVVREPVGVCGLITPWNWPVNQIMCKVAPALAAGCTMVLKPSEVTPLSAIVIAEIIDAAGVPAGVFNLVQGDGATVGAAISAHPDIDMVSFTGSTRAGVEVARAAAPSVKRVTQELGGKSANIVLADADLEKAVAGGFDNCARNSGQSCNAPTRMFVPRDRHEEALEIARRTAESVTVGDPTDAETAMGPVVSEVQFDKIQGLIQAGIDEGALLVTGGPGRPDGLDAGWYVRPTVFGGVTNDMTIAREEIFGPVLSILPYDTEEEAIELANDTDYGLSAYVQSGEVEHAAAVGAQLRAGQVHLNGAPANFDVPFGGYKQSGNGREWGIEGFDEFLETKALLGVDA